jgi:hypothetical protein
LVLWWIIILCRLKKLKIMNKFLYRNAYWLYFWLVDIRMTWYIYTGRKEKAAKIINEHRKWDLKNKDRYDRR